MIIAKVRGGLGNQLFIYAAARALALDRKTEMALDLSEYEEYSRRTFILPHLCGQKQEADPADIARLKKIAPHDFPSRWMRRINLMLGLGQPVYYRQPGYAFDRRFLLIGPEAYLDGLFQSEKFFAHRAGEIRKGIFPVSYTHLTLPTIYSV